MGALGLSKGYTRFIWGNYRAQSSEDQTNARKSPVKAIVSGSGGWGGVRSELLSRLITGIIGISMRLVELVICVLDRSP